MKKLIQSFATALLIIAVVPSQLGAATISEPTSIATRDRVVVMSSEVMMGRLEQIKAMDKSKMSNSEKRELRKEVQKIKKYFSPSGGVYISVGALILILILLIILL